MLFSCFFCSLVGLFFFFFASHLFLLSVVFFFTRRSLSRATGALDSFALVVLLTTLVLSHVVGSLMRALLRFLSLACTLWFALSHNSSHVFVVAATVVIAHTIALSGLGPGANFIQQFNSIIGSDYGYLFYTFLLIISVILAGNMASVFCHMFALNFLFFSKFPFMLPFTCVCLCLFLYEIATSTLIFSVANQFADRPGTS